jgi:hypothetical protein
MLNISIILLNNEICIDKKAQIFIGKKFFKYNIEKQIIFFLFIIILLFIINLKIIERQLTI